MFERGDLLSFAGAPVDAALFQPYVPSTDLIEQPSSLRDRFRTNGYVFLPGLLDAELVLAARRELLLQYAVVGEIDDSEPLMNGVAGDRAGLATANMRAFTEAMRTGARYEAVILAPTLLDVVRSLLDGPVRPYDFRWPRLARPDEGCGLHCDGPYMSRGTDRHLSIWIPFGAVAPHEGGLILLGGSHRNDELAAGYLTMDADTDGLVWLDDDLGAVAARYGEQWLTSAYEPGDVLVFSMSMLHGALDNRSPERRCRLSTDSRYLVAGELPDPRWNGDDINPHGPGRVFYPGLGAWRNKDFQDEWKYVDDQGRLQLRNTADAT